MCLLFVIWYFSCVITTLHAARFDQYGYHGDTNERFFDQIYPRQSQLYRTTPRETKVMNAFITQLKTKCKNDVICKTLLENILVNSLTRNLQSMSPIGVKYLQLHDPVKKLYIAILSDPDLYMYFNQMFEQQNPSGIVENWQEFIVLLNYVMTYPPQYNRYSDSFLLCCPINALLDWPSSTPAGRACFLHENLNKLAKDILNYWGKYLQSKASTTFLSDSLNGWFSDVALEAMKDSHGRTFQQQFVCDPMKPHWGFQSWDDFFTRKFREGMRPLPYPDSSKFITNACESVPIKIARDVKARDMFWIKEQPYSLSHMLNNNRLHKYFIGGTVYQGFLSTNAYHRWHSPISGTIIDYEHIQGAYFSQAYSVDGDSHAPVKSQSYLSQVAARAAIYILADDPEIGVICFLSIGMVEISSNEITVQKGQHVDKGDELGMFHYGGSSHCLIFPPHLDVVFDVVPTDVSHEMLLLREPNIHVRSKIATVRLKTQHHGKIAREELRRYTVDTFYRKP
eukprot:TCONS_00055488-protein